MVRVHHSSTFSLEEGELKDCMRRNEGIKAGVIPEVEVSQNGPAGSACEAELSTHCGFCLERRSCDFGSGGSFLLVHRRVSPSHELVHPLACGMCGQPDGGIDA